VNSCRKDTCQNKGVCRPLLHGYKCECLGINYYSGDHCEITSKKVMIFKTMSKSFASVAIIAMAGAAMFIIIMDVMKYCFGIDPTREELERMRRKKRKPVIQRFIYVNAPLPSIPEETIV
jgi:hypothetical protein